MADRFEDLRNYAAVVASGGVNAAAEELGIAKSAVSRRLSELEARLGVTLIDRTTRRFELTAVGRDYHRRALEILASLDTLDEETSGGGETAAGPIRLAADRDLIARLLVPAVACFLAANEGVTIEVSVFTPGVGPSCDLLVSSSPQNHSAAERTELGEHKQLTCAAPAYLASRGTPASASDLLNHARIAITDNRSGHRAASAGKTQPAIFVPDAEAALAAAIAGAGIAQLPDFVARDALARGELTVLKLDRPAPPGRIVASFAGDCPVSVRRLVDHLAASLKPNG